MAKSPQHLGFGLLGYNLTAYILFCAVLSIALMHWRDAPVPPLPEQAFPPAPTLQHRPAPDFRNISRVQEKKAAFFEFIAEGARLQNRYLSQMRDWLQNQQKRLNAGLAIDTQAIARLAKEYRVAPSRSTPNKTDNELGHQQLENLLLHVDEIPISLVLAQAANESAWGTSRFAREANNFFGQWCFSRGCGLVPQQRPSGASYEVKKFASADESIAAYYHNLNSHPSYHSLRQIRSRLRQQQKPIDAMQLAEGLTNYSSRGAAYVEELQAMIRYNRLQEFDVISQPDSANQKVGDF